MLWVNADFSTLQPENAKRSPNLILLLTLIATCFFSSMGCSSMQASSAPLQQDKQSTPLITIQTALPNGTVSSSYHEQLSVSGGLAPYQFLVALGALPSGLSLNQQTGDISGTPTLPGNFRFAIEVTDSSSEASGGPAHGVRAYTVNVNPYNRISVQISPTSLSVEAGAKIQFGAVVGNTANTAVTWAASAGSISASGLFTAPLNTSAKSITVTATSTAEPSIQASAAVTMTSGSQFTIATANVPSAVESTPYSASLSASGGQPPYQWSIASGSLPPGLQLDASSGTLSGSATQKGDFNFSVRGTDSASHTAERSLSLLVSAAASNCGPPTYNCSRTDFGVVQVPSPPSVGNLLGANTIVTDPDFGNRIVRITDAHTNPHAHFKNRTYFSSSSGSADENLWNLDSTLLVVQDTGANSFPFTFDPSTLQAARMYVSRFPDTNGLMLRYSGNWSRVDPNVFYTFEGTNIRKYDFTDRTNPPSAQPVADFKSGSNCLPAGFSATWSDNGGVGGDDTVFGMVYSNRGPQGTGTYAVVYKVGSGCSMLNTETGHVTGDWGASGTINIADRWTIHNAKLSKDGNWLIIARDLCTSFSCTQAPYFWQIGTTNVNSCGDGGSCSGHWTEGNSHWVNNDNSPMSNQVIRSLAQANSVSNLTFRFPADITTPFDQHQSWNNVDPDDSLPFFSSTWSTISPFPAPWYNEIIAVAADGTDKTWRFGHTFITTKSQRFSTSYAIGSVSQDGKFFMFSSDWMGTLGSESGGKACTIGSDCRGDVFVIELR
ncbi:MAG: Ig domain-containing protein [Candidatus Sulfotelmatobacter sp.]